MKLLLLLLIICILEIFSQTTKTVKKDKDKVYGTESIYSRPLKIPGGKLLYKPKKVFRHTIYVTESPEFGKIATEKTSKGLKQTSNWNSKGWTLEKQKPITNRTKFINII